MDPETAPILRRAIRAHLAARPSIAQSPATLHRYLGAEHGAGIDDVKNAAEFLVGIGHLHSAQDPLGGSAIYYQATPAGILAHERGE